MPIDKDGGGGHNCWYKMTMEDVQQQWMRTNQSSTADPIKLEPTKGTFAEQKYVHVHDRFQQIEHPSDRICKDCYLVQSKYHANQLVNELKEQNICWIQATPHYRLPVKVAPFAMLGKTPIRVLSHGFVCLQLPQLVFSTLPRDPLEVRPLSDQKIACRCVLASSRCV